MTELTQNLLQELFKYNDGKLYWAIRPSKWSRMIIGDMAGGNHHSGYRYIQINGKSYAEHRLIFLHQNGYIDNNLQIDHIDDNKSNNKIENLRLVTCQENCIDRDKNAKGYSFDKKCKTFNARIRIDGKLKHLGCFNNEILARDAYLKALKEKI